MNSVVDMRLVEITDLCRRTEAGRLDIFGSGVRADHHSGVSDLDFLVEFDDLPPARFAVACFALKESREALFGTRIDLNTGANLDNSHFRARVMSECQTRHARWRA